MADGLSFTDRLSNLFSSTNGKNNTRRDFKDTLNDSLKFISNFTTPNPVHSQEASLNLSTYGPYPTSGNNTLNTTPTLEPNFGNQTETSISAPVPVTENPLLAAINLEISFRIFYSFALILLTILGILGNLLVAITILRKTPLWVTKQVTNVLIFNLAVADLFILIGGALPGIVGTILGKSPLDPLTCRIQGSLILSAFLASICTLGIISIDRFIVKLTLHLFCSKH